MSTILLTDSDRGATYADRDWLLILLLLLPLLSGIISVTAWRQQSSSDWEQHPELMSWMSP